MPEPTWAEGYVVDIGYTHGYYRELAPPLLRFVTLLGGVRAADTEQPFTYYELGCGNGRSLVLHAAANPHGQFIGVDFNPGHVQNAQRLARECGVGNVRFLEKSFAELLAMELPDAEAVVLHGVYSWVSDENRHHIVEFLRRRLKSGGIVYVSYNCLPGLAQVAPLQRLMHEHASLAGGDLVERMRRALEFAARLGEAGAEYFRANPLGQSRLARMGTQDPRYLAHEYFNASWSPAYHADVAREVAEAKLAYAGSAELPDNFEQFAVKPEVAKAAAGINDRIMAETIKDFARNRVFRKDVYTRGAPRASAAELETMLGRTRFALAQPRVGCKLTKAMPAGEVTLAEDAYAPVLDALARSPMTFDELARAPETSRLDRTRLRQAVFGMAAFGNILPSLPAAGADERAAATARFNKAALQSPVPGAAQTILASPVLGAGIAVGYIDHCFLSAPDPKGDVAAYAWQMFAAGGHKPQRDGKPLESEKEIRELIAERARSYFGTLLPHLRLLGVVE